MNVKSQSELDIGGRETCYAYSHFSLQEMMTSVALGPTPRQVLSQGGYFLPHDSPVDNTFRSD